jgi:hypothetical protein
VTNTALVRAIRDSLPPSLEWTAVDEAVLALAEAQAADLDALEARDDLAGVRERRFQRAALCSIIGRLDLPNNARSSVLKAQRAAAARWGMSSA